MKLTKLSAAPTLAPQAALSRRCRRMPALSRLGAGTASQLIPGVRRTKRARTTAIAVVAIGSLGSAAAQEQPPPVPPVVRIGDDICAVNLKVECDVVDAHRRPVGGVELSGLHQWMKHEPDWHSIGITSSNGRVEGYLCLQSSSVYLKTPPRGRLDLTFRVSGAGHGPLVLHQTAEAQDVLHAGLLVENRGGNVVPLVEAIRKKAAYRVRLRARLED
jgi:hypothetical protein